MRGSEIGSEYLRAGEIWTCALGWHERGSQLGLKEHLPPTGLWVVCPRTWVFPRRRKASCKPPSLCSVAPNSGPRRMNALGRADPEVKMPDASL